MELLELLGIDLPIIQAPMAGVQGSALAVAVSNAGGLGSLPGALLSPDALRKELGARNEACPLFLSLFLSTREIGPCALTTTPDVFFNSRP